MRMPKRPYASCAFFNAHAAPPRAPLNAADDAAVASGDALACEELVLERAGAGLSDTMRRVRPFGRVGYLR